MAGGAEIKDAEPATHGYDAALIQAQDVYEFPAFKVVQFNLPVLSHYSYLLVNGKNALVVDPARDVQAYLDYAEEEGLGYRPPAPGTVEPDPPGSGAAFPRLVE